MFFKAIKKTKHYIEFHEKEIPWHAVIQIILTTKNKRNKGNKIEIETNRVYILCKLESQTLFVINAKVRK